MKIQGYTNSNKAVDSTDKLVNEFIEISVWLNNLILELGIPVHNREAGWSAVVSAFQSLPEGKKIEINNRLSFYTDVCSTTRANSYAGLNDNRVSWYAIKKLGLIPPAGLFEQIKETDCIEIYDGMGVQIFRNFNFCEHVSYSIQECLIYPWDQLYKRSEEILGVMMGEAGKAFTGAREPFYSQIPAHTCTEIKTKNKRMYQVKFNLISPLFDGGGATRAFLVTSNLKVLRDIGADNTLEIR